MHVLDVPVVHLIAVRCIAFRIKPARLNLGIVISSVTLGTWLSLDRIHLSKEIVRVLT